jgi:SH2 domain
MKVGLVCAYAFQNYVLRWFSPMQSFLLKILDVAQLGCFHPFFESKDAVQHLKITDRVAPGSFLIRFSRRNPGVFAYCFVGKGGKFFHDLIHVEKAHDGQMSRVYWKRQPGVVMGSVSRLTQAHSLHFLYPCCGKDMHELEDSDEELYDTGDMEENEELEDQQRRVSEVEPPAAAKASGSASTTGQLISSRNKRASMLMHSNIFKKKQLSAAELLGPEEAKADDSAGDSVPFAIGEKLLAQAYLGDIEKDKISPQNIDKLHKFVANLPYADFEALHNQLWKRIHPEAAHVVGGGW